VIANTPEAWTERAALDDRLEAVMWTHDGQVGRFLAVLHALAPKHGETLLDYGCGTGELSEFTHPRTPYTGVDWSRGMIARARLEHPGKRFSIYLGPETFDLVACVGTFNLPGSLAQTWDDLAELWGRTRRSLAACLYAGDDQNCLRYTQSQVLRFAEQHASDFSVNKHRPNDILLVMNR
jgi:SAM-dependent methyltransferase